ncbi:MAG TPA: 3-dehydroquinate synthase [Alphaproteobacteria bacterium]|jgi:3-dehydroquinate synthase|nr:3-dehydroquinate synthase [Alphaproteobacteria bacterium]
MSVPREELVTVALGDRSYPIHIGPGLLADLGNRLAPFLKRNRVALVTDRNVADLHLAAAEAALRAAGIACVTQILPPGEQTKNFATLERLLDWLLAEKIERGDLILALGGGVIGDLTGFAAAILRRGVDFAQIPTTLLAQVDSSVGGKTAINSPHGKNLIGAFHQPRIVLADIALLDSLPRRELLAGYAEVVKYGLLGDAAFFDWLEQHGAALCAGDLPARVEAVTQSCRAKAQIVAADEREAGQRALLNLGHTFGHALEQATNYDARLLHGEGVAIGMCLAFALSHAMGLATGQEVERVKRHLSGIGLPVRVADIKGADIDVDTLLAGMAQDKKVADGRINFILPRAIGDSFVTDQVDPDLVRQVLAASLVA